MSVRRMDHVGVVVDDLDAATAFFAALGLEVQGELEMDGALVDRLVGLEGVHTRFAFMRTPDGHGQLELIEFLAPRYDGDVTPQPAHAPGLRHLTFAVDDIEAALARLQAEGGELVGTVEQYETSYKLCYVRGPSGIIVELAEKLG